MGTADNRRDVHRDALLACALACLLAAAWAMRDWANLSALRLPDTDDAMRLQQIRDWLAGQNFADLSQHRLAGGLAMHWSRLPDLVPGAIIYGLAPLIGRHAAEMAAVIVWPTLLFASALYFVARIARLLGGAQIAATALIVAAIAYPATTLFLPGRIDHHGFQILLLLVVVRALVAPASVSLGVQAGIAAAASIVIGLETAPLLAATGAVMAAQWVLKARRAEDRLMGFGIALGAGLLGAQVIFRSQQWGYPACDGFTAIAWRGAQLAAFAPILMALTGRMHDSWRSRAPLSLAIGGVFAFAAYRNAPQCLSPYGGMDPMLSKLWLANVGEAQPLFQAAPAVAIGYAGLMIAGIAATIWRLQATRKSGWAVLLALQCTALVLACLQLRGAYAGAILAAPGLAAVIAAARQRGSLWLAGAWIASAGMLYPLAADAMTPNQASPPEVDTSACTSPEALARLDRLPVGRMLAPLDLGAFLIAGTHHSAIAAPYHRNNVGNAAAYRFFLSDPETAAALARRWRIDYVALCPTSFDEIDGDVQPGAMLAALRSGGRPLWLKRINHSGTLALYRVVSHNADRTGDQDTAP